jgi:hypothetical protein
MIKQMIIQMGYFLLIVLSVMFAFGIISQSLMYPNQPLNSQLLRKIFLPAYFVIGTEFYMRNLMMNGKIRIFKNWRFFQTLIDLCLYGKNRKKVLSGCGSLCLKFRKYLKNSSL